MSSLNIGTLTAEPVFVNLSRSLGVDSQPGPGPVRQPYLTYRPARLLDTGLEPTVGCLCHQYCYISTNLNSSSYVGKPKENPLKGGRVYNTCGFDR